MQESPVPSRSDIASYLDMHGPWGRTWSKDHGCEDDNKTILYHICKGGCNVGSLKALLDHPRCKNFVPLNSQMSDVKARSEYFNEFIDASSSYLHLLAIDSIKYRADSIKILSDAGADVNRTTLDGVSPLIVAAKNKNIPAIFKLLHCGAKTNIVDSNGKTALGYLLSKSADAKDLDFDSAMDVMMQYPKDELNRELSNMLDQYKGFQNRWDPVDRTFLKEMVNLDRFNELNSIGAMVLLADGGSVDTFIRCRQENLRKVLGDSLRDDHDDYWTLEANKEYASMILKSAQYYPPIQSKYKLQDKGDKAIQTEALEHVAEAVELPSMIPSKMIKQAESTSKSSQKIQDDETSPLLHQPVTERNTWVQKATQAVANLLPHSTHPPSSDGAPKEFNFFRRGVTKQTSEGPARSGK